MNVERLAPIAMPLLLTFFMLNGCATAKQTAGQVSQSQLPDSANADTKSSAASDKPVGKIDFASGESPVASIDGLRTKEIIQNCLKGRRNEVDLEASAAFISKISRDDLLPFCGPGASLVRKIRFPPGELTDSDIEPLSALHLDTLTMSGNKLTDLHALAKMKTLFRLDLSKSPLNDTGFINISGLPNLAVLSVAGTPITDQNLALLSRMNKFQELDLTGCTRLSKKAIQQFKKMHPVCSLTYTPNASINTDYADTSLRQVERELIGQHEYEEADLTLAKLITNFEKQNPQPSRLLAKHILIELTASKDVNHPQKARLMMEAALTNYITHLPDDQKIPVARARLAMVLEQLGLSGEALTQSKEAASIWQRLPASGADTDLYNRNQKYLKMHISK